MKKLFIVLALGACELPKDPGVPPVVEKPYASWPNQEWAKHAEKKVSETGLDKLVLADAKLFCPNGMSTRNWVHLMGAMVKYESGFKPELEYKESFRNSKGEYVISTGLFQVSYESSRGYGFSGITTQDLKNPLKNIDVAVAILKKLTGQNGVIANHSGTSWKGGSRYWSVLRPNGKLPSVKATLKPWCE